MRREIIQDFLNVPGIVGVALMDGLSSPYFRGFKLSHTAEFEPEQQITLAQSIQQVLETTPEGFNSFEFQFDYHRVYLHKLNQGITLLVLASNQVPRQLYTQAVRRLLIELQIDQADPIAEFRTLALDIPLPAALPLQLVEDFPAEDFLAENSPAEPLPIAPLPLAWPRNLSANPGSDQLPDQQSVSAQIYKLPGPASERQPTELKQVDLKDVLAAINGLSQLTTQYLGTMVVSNYWKTTRPPVDWLNHFQIERSAQMTFSVQMPSDRLPILTVEQHQCLQAWIAAFIERCSKVIRDFTRIVHQALGEQQIALLFDSN